MKYLVTIKLANSSILHKGYNIPYYMSGTKTDEVVFNANNIIIRANRGKLYSEKDIFLNVQNSLYNQLYKCLLFHYALNGERAKIVAIVIDVVGFSGNPIHYERCFNNENQPFPLYKSPIAFKPQVLELLLNETDESFLFRLIMGHWMSAAVQDNGKIRKLECIWRTFERLCAYHRHRSISERPNITDGLKQMIGELTTNPQYYPQSSSFVHSFTYEYLRGFLWHDMISNNYPKGGNENKYRDYVRYMVRPFTDVRVMSLMYDVRKYRKRDLIRHGFYSSMKSDCEHKINNPSQKDIDIVALLCCHYAYYLRNRLFHGQSLVRSSIFRHNEDDMRLCKISLLLELLTIELINNISNL